MTDFIILAPASSYYTMQYAVVKKNMKFLPSSLASLWVKSEDFKSRLSLMQHLFL